MQQDRQGFSFIELIIVVVIVVAVIREIVISYFV
jgi:prepilin-type N-terminal cleavage/methylation domain-containing protein